MSQINVVGRDLAKQVFQDHAITSEGAVVARRQLRCSQVLTFFSKLPSCLVGMEACGAHFWAREIRALGDRVRLMSPSYVKPYVKRGKTILPPSRSISRRCGDRSGSSTPSAPSPARRPCWPTYPATPTASRSRTAGSSPSTSAASRSAGRTTAPGPVRRGASGSRAVARA